MCIWSPLFKEGLSVDVVLAHGGGLPGEVGAAGVALEQERLPGLVPPADEQRHAEWPHPSGLSVLLSLVNGQNRSL